MMVGIRGVVLIWITGFLTRAYLVVSFDQNIVFDYFL